MLEVMAFRALQEVMNIAWKTQIFPMGLLNFVLYTFQATAEAMTHQQQDYLGSLIEGFF